MDLSITAKIMNIATAGKRFITGTEWTDLAGKVRRSLDVNARLQDASGLSPGDVGYVGPVVQAREPACFVSITPASLTTNVYTVTGAPAKGIEVINDSAGEITVTLSDGTTSIVETLKPDDTYSQTFEIDVETVTFSAGAVFRADLLR